ncbi:MAG: hypothetical protein AB8B73_10670 [Ekhidna sp.]
MINYRTYLLAAIPFLILFACQENSFTQEDEVLIDTDMDAAILLADEHQISENGRSDSRGRAITVFRCHKGVVYFDTNTDDYRGYQVLEETSVTAIVQPGEYIYWYSGGGITDLENIEFDSESESYLEELPEEFKPNRMWVLEVPENYDLTQDHLKYDIVYESKDNEGYIRLDPKIQVKQ